MKKNKNFFLPLSLGGLCAGFANGLLGAGGGIIIVYIFSRVFERSTDRRDIFANALCIMMPISVVSCIIYALRGDLNASGFSPFIIPAILGGLLGGFVLCKINTEFLKILFSALVVISGIILVVK